jgi:hypothetical protein
MPVLPDQRDSHIIKHGHGARSARMVNDISLICRISLTHGVKRDVKDLAVINLFSVEYLWSLAVGAFHTRVVSASGLKSDQYSIHDDSAE